MNQLNGWGNALTVRAGTQWLRSLRQNRRRRVEVMLLRRQGTERSRNQLFQSKVIKSRELVRK